MASSTSQPDDQTRGRVSRKDNFNLFRSTQHGRADPHDWVVYAGAWTIWPGKDVTAEPTKELVGRRCFKPEGDGWSLYHVNVLNKELDVGARPKLRDDGWQWSEYHRSLTDPSFSASFELSEEEKLPGGNASNVPGRLLAVSNKAYANIKGAIPSQQTGDPAPPQLLKDGATAAAPLNVWHYEVFLHDGDHRWSIGAGWDGLSGALLRQFMIREYWQEGAAPADTLPDAKDVPMPAARDRLEEGELQKHSRGRRGRLARIVFDESGTMFRDEDQHDAAVPPLQDDSSYGLYCYPDKLFAHVPSTLPKAGSEGGTWRFTWGGIMYGGQYDFQQLQTKYCGRTGRLLEVTNFTS